MQTLMIKPPLPHLTGDRDADARKKAREILFTSFLALLGSLSFFSKFYEGVVQSGLTATLPGTPLFAIFLLGSGMLVVAVYGLIQWFHLRKKSSTND